MLTWSECCRVRSIPLTRAFFDVCGIVLRTALSSIACAMKGHSPQEERAIRLPIHDVPEGRNQVVPSLQIAGIVFDDSRQPTYGHSVASPFPAKRLKMHYSSM